MNTNYLNLITSKKTDHWQTPKSLYKELDKEFNFDFDPCPLKSSFNGLQMDWGKRNFVNPPYTNITAFLKKSEKEIKNGNSNLCVFLLFSSTDTKWFHDYIYKKAEIRFIKGRIKFLNDKGLIQDRAMRPSMIVIFRKNLDRFTPPQTYI